MEKLKRILRHMFTTQIAARRTFPPHVRDEIARAIARNEKRHMGEIRFVVESHLELGPLLRGHSPRERAIEIFTELRMWDTAQKSGVLIYLLLADRDIEIVADRGFEGKVTQAEWEGICRHMEQLLRDGNYSAAALAGVEEVGALLTRTFPGQPGNRDELKNDPIVF